MSYTISLNNKPIPRAMSENRLPKLINRIHEKTMSRDLKWEITANDEKFQCAFTKFVITILPRPNKESPSELDYIFTILDEDGAIVDRIDDIELTQLLVENYGGTRNEGYDVLSEIHDVARRIARGTEDAIDSLLDELEDF